MLHTFEFGAGAGDTCYYIFDSETCCLLRTERQVFLYVKKLENGLSKPENSEYKSLSKAITDEIESELRELEEDGVIGGCSEKITPLRSTDIKSLCLNVCHDCNLRCTYCFASQGSYETGTAASEAKYMSLETGKAAVDFLIEKSGKRKKLEIDFFGGEPLLNFEVVKAITEYALKRCGEAGKAVSFTMTTNAMLLNGETSEWLNLNMENVVISIDGRRQVHDALRKTAGGRGSFDIVLKNALKFRALRGEKRYYIRGTFTRDNLDFGEDILYLNDAGFDQISLEPVVLAPGDRLSIGEAELPAVLKEYERFAALYLKRRETGKWFNFFHFMIDLDKGPCVYKRLNGCGAGIEYAAVTPSGDIYPCHQFIGNAAYLMGNVKTGALDRTVQKRFVDSNVYTKDNCADCFAKYFCGGGCAANSVSYEGDIDKNNPVYCAIMKKRLELSLAIKGIERGKSSKDL